MVGCWRLAISTPSVKFVDGLVVNTVGGADGAAHLAACTLDIMSARFAIVCACSINMIPSSSSLIYTR